MKNDLERREKWGMKVLIGLLSALPVLLIVFVIFFIAPGILKQRTVLAESSTANGAGSSAAAAAVYDGADLKEPGAGEGGISYDEDIALAFAEIEDETVEEGGYTGDGGEESQAGFVPGTDPEMPRGFVPDTDVETQEGYPAENPEDTYENEPSETEGEDSADPGRSKWVNHSGDKVFEDFEWLRRILFDKEKPRDLFPDGKIVRSKDEIEGEWEAYMTDDPEGSQTYLMDADIKIDGDNIRLTLKWRKRILEASGEVIDMTRDKPAVLKGKLSDDLTHFWLEEENGIWRSQIAMFFEENGRQYGSASYVIKKQDGSEKNVSSIGFTREH